MFRATRAFQKSTMLRAASRRALSTTRISAAATGQRVLILGSGNVVSPAVEYLAEKSELAPTITLGSNDPATASELATKYKRVTAAHIDVTDNAALDAAIAEHDLVVSLVPWKLHPDVARACINRKVNMVTTSYVSPAMEEMHDDAVAAGVTILNEIGLDPGIDHLGAMRVIDDVKDRGGRIKSFVSFCGGLPAAEASFVPLQYKFSWSPKGVLLAGLSQAVYREDGVDHTTDAGKLFNYDRPMDLFPSLNIEGYPNRNSLVYESVYGIEGADTILRGTLRFKGFCKVMRAMQSMGLFAEASVPAGGTNWAKCVASVLNASGSDARAAAEDFLKTGGASPSDIRYILDTLDRLGLLSDTEPVPNAPSVIDAVCSQLEKKLQYGPGERDMVLLSHQFVASWPDGSESDISSTFVRCGDPNGHTAMAETVGIPCALGVEHVLRGTVSGAGVIRPVDRALYKPLLADLEKLGISMIEEERPRPM